MTLSKFCGFGACKNHFKKKRRDPESKDKLVLICERCELGYLNKILQVRFVEKRGNKEKILKSLEEKYQQTQENLKKKKQVYEILEGHRKDEERQFYEKMIQMTDQINRKKQETARMEKENRELSQKYEEITSKIKEKEGEISEIQKQVAEATRINEELTKKIEGLSKEKAELKREIEEKETFLQSKERIPRPSDSRKHYENQSEVTRLKKNDDDLEGNEMGQNREKACLSVCKCRIF